MWVKLFWVDDVYPSQQISSHIGMFSLAVRMKFLFQVTPK